MYEKNRSRKMSITNVTKCYKINITYICKKSVTKNVHHKM